MKKTSREKRKIANQQKVLAKRLKKSNAVIENFEIKIQAELVKKITKIMRESTGDEIKLEMNELEKIAEQFLKHNLEGNDENDVFLGMFETEAEFVNLTNDIREKNNLPPVSLIDLLCDLDVIQINPKRRFYFRKTKIRETDKFKLDHKNQIVKLEDK